MTGEANLAADVPLSSPAQPEPASKTVAPGPHHAAPASFWAMALGSAGVVFGDIGTSPLYAFKLALAQAAIGRRTAVIFMLGATGAALFYGDAVITPAISVLSAVEGLKSVPAIGDQVSLSVILIVSLVILIGLFMVQSRGTAKVAVFFGPICMVWFIAIAGLGLLNIARDPSVILAISPSYAVMFLARHGMVGLFVLGSVFLTVTGAEALYADMGHFGRWPIQAAWLFLVLPCLVLNYLGQGAFALSMLHQAHGHPVGDVDWFFQMTPAVLRVPMVVLAMAATVIASQAVITGAYSLTNQAMQLGLLPRMVVRRTSETQAGQIYLPQINTLLLIGVIMLIAVFKSSDSLGNAYGLAVTGTMAVTTSLAFIVVYRRWRWPLIGVVAMITPMLLLDLVFLGANALKLLSGAALPLILGAALFAVMATWVRGSDILTAKVQRDTPLLDDFLPILAARPPHRVAGAAIYLTADPTHAPGALLHNLKHNKVLHQQNVILNVETLETPRVAEIDRVKVMPINDDFQRVTIKYGFMETPNIPRALIACRKQGLSLDLMSASFFLGRKTVVSTARGGLGGLQDKLFLVLAKNAANPTDFFHIPPGRVLEMGAQVTV